MAADARPGHDQAPAGVPPGGLSSATVLAGARAILPLSLGVFPFGLVYGVTVAESSIEDWVGVLASLVVLAGAAQLAMVDLLEDGAPWFVVVATALVINARLVMYSGALAPSFSEYPRRWRVPLAHFMTDQAVATSLLYDQGQRDPRMRMAFYLGAGASFAATWLLGTILGVILGATIPPEFQLGFAVPLMFLALLVPSVRDGAGLVATAVAFAVTLLAREAPLNTGLLIGATAGIAFGMLVRLRSGGRQWPGHGGDQRP